MIVISLIGLAGAGKDTIAAHLEEILTKEGYSVRRAAFADPLKKIAGSLFDLDVARLNDQDYKNTELRHLPKPESPIVKFFMGNVLRRPKRYFTPREILQTFGTDVCRKINPSTWARMMGKEIEKAKADGVDFFIISDMRFLNEYLYVSAYSYVCDALHYPVKVRRVSESGKELSAAPSHVSEKQIKDMPDQEMKYIVECKSRDMRCLHIHAKFIARQVIEHMRVPHNV